MGIVALGIWGTLLHVCRLHLLVSLRGNRIVLLLIVHEALQIVLELSSQIGSMLLDEVPRNKWEVIVFILFLLIIILLFFV